jgi:transcriptional regulator with XRE-family HTH domain
MTARPAAATVPPDRIPAQTIRRLRAFHNFSREAFADVFKVTLRTVFRWERDGVDPASLQLDADAISGPEWRRKYMNWLLERYEAPGVTDTRKKQGESP